MYYFTRKSTFIIDPRLGLKGYIKEVLFGLQSDKDGSKSQCLE